MNTATQSSNRNEQIADQHKAHSDSPQRSAGAPEAACAAALAWADRLFDSEGRALVSKALTSAGSLARRHPAAAIALGMGGLGLAWFKIKSNEEEATFSGYAAAKAEHARDMAHSAKRSLAGAASAGIDAARDRYSDMADSLEHGSENILERARHLRSEAQLGFRKARRFASEEPTIAVAGGVASGVALALGALVVARLLKK